MKLSVRRCVAEGERCPRPRNHRASTTSAATAKPDAHTTRVIQSRGDRTIASVPYPARTARTNVTTTRPRCQRARKGSWFTSDASSGTNTRAAMTMPTTTKARTSGL